MKFPKWRLNNGVIASELKNGECLSELKKLEDNSIDAIVPDPPYGLSFMGKKWDYDIPNQVIWRECLRVLKPGGHMLVACGTKTQHRMAVAIEDGGFQIRDIVSWIYGSGFPKSLDIGKAYDRIQGNEREVISTRIAHDIRGGALLEAREPSLKKQDNKIEVATTKGDSEWEGWGTALKPAQELWTLARKPLSEKTIITNVLRWGTGGMNIDKCRVGDECRYVPFASNGSVVGQGTENTMSSKGGNYAKGRFPANVIHDGSGEVIANFPRDTFKFFYCPKPSKNERNSGLEKSNTSNIHPTVKPVNLMRYLCRLITPKSGLVLDPFMGSGTTGVACSLEGFRFIGIERETDYYDIADKRINYARAKKK